MSEHGEHSEHAKSTGGHHGGGGHHHHGGGGHGDGEHEGAPEWLISFADNVMLMMGLFVIMLAMNMAKVTTGGIGGEDEMGGAPSAEMADFILSVREAFNNPVNINSTDPRDAALVKRLIERANRGKATEEGPSGKNNQLQGVRDADYKSISATIEFGELSAKLSEDAITSIANTAAQIKGYQNVVEIRGHVSSHEIRSDQDAGYELAFQRALAVAHELATQGVSWSQLRVIACSDSERVSEGYYDRKAGDTDRRVEIVVTGAMRSDR